MLIYLSMIEVGGDRENFERYYRKYAEDIFGRIYSILKNREDAEDVMQETWRTVVEHIAKFRGKDDREVRAYIMRIAHNRAIDVLRGKKRERELFRELTLVEPMEEQALFALCGETDPSDILACFSSLDAIYRDVLNLYYLHDHSVKEIARLLCLSETAVGSRLTRGRKRLYDMMTETASKGKGERK